MDILGTKWNLKIQTLKENGAFENCDGYCDPSIKTIFIRKYEDGDVKELSTPIYKDRGYMQEKVLRHEVIHAYMYESGLWRNSCYADMPWSMFEEMTDWIAIQMPKIKATCEELGCL